MKRLAIVSALTLLSGACANDEAAPAGPTDDPGPSATSPPAVTGQDLAAADILLITGETQRDLELGGYGFRRSDISSPGPTIQVEHGKPLTVALKNVHGYIDGEDIDHDFAVVAQKDESSEPLWGSQTDTIDPGQADIVTFTTGDPGNYFYICTLSGHLSAHGMWGRFIVEEVVA